MKALEEARMMRVKILQQNENSLSFYIDYEIILSYNYLVY